MWHRFCAICIFYLSTTPTDAGKPKSVNLNLETVLEFDEQNLATDVQLIDNVQSFLSKVRKVLDETTDDQSGRRSSGAKKPLKMIEFLRNAVSIITSYEDEDLLRLLQITDDELRKYHYKGCKFYELLQNEKVRNYISNTLEEMRSTPLRRIRRFLEKVLSKLQSKNFSLIEKKVISFIDSLYAVDGSENFYILLKDLEQYRNQENRSEMDLQKILRGGIRSLIFNHYSQLHPNVRRDLRRKLSILAGGFGDNEKIDLLLLDTDDVITQDETLLKDQNGDDDISVEDKRLVDNDVTSVDKKENGDNDNKNNDTPLVEKKKAPSKEVSSESDSSKRQTKRVESKLEKKRYISVTPEHITKKPKKKEHHTQKKKSLRRIDPVTMMSLLEAEHKPKLRHEKKKKTDHIINFKHSKAETSAPKKKAFTKKFSKKPRNTHTQSDDDNKHVAEVEDREVKLQQEDTPELREEQETDDGIPIENFESNDLTGHFKFRRSFDMRDKRSQKRKEEVIRRRIQPLLDKPTPTTPDSRILINRINNLEKQIELMKHKIDSTNNVKKVYNDLFIPLHEVPEIVKRKPQFVAELPYWSGGIPTKTTETTTTAMTAENNNNDNNTNNDDNNNNDYEEEAEAETETEATETTVLTPKRNVKLNSKIETVTTSRTTTVTNKVKPTVTLPVTESKRSPNDIDSNIVENKVVLLPGNSLPYFNETADKKRLEVKLDGREIKWNDKSQSSLKQAIVTPTTEVTETSTVRMVTKVEGTSTTKVKVGVKTNTTIAEQ